MNNYPVGSNTDSGAKNGAQCRDNTILYLAYIVRNLNEISKIYRILKKYYDDGVISIAVRKVKYNIRYYELNLTNS